MTFRTRLRQQECLRTIISGVLPASLRYPQQLHPRWREVSPAEQQAFDNRRGAEAEDILGEEEDIPPLLSRTNESLVPCGIWRKRALLASSRGNGSGAAAACQRGSVDC